MSAIRLPVPLRRVPPGAWTAVLWCAYAAYSVRMFLGIPGLPYVPGQLRPSAWLLTVPAAAVAVAGGVLLSRRPLPALGLLLAASAAAAVALDAPTISYLYYLAAAAALGVIVATRSRLAGAAAMAMTLGVLPAYAALRMGYGASDNHSPGWQVCVLTAIVAWLAGNSVRMARDYAGKLRARAAAEAVTAERLRISRELHDTVAHSIGIIALQAGAAARVIDTQPQRAREALREVETASRETLAGLRRVLATTHRTGPGPGPAEPGEPAPGLADVERLAAAATAAGIRVDVRWRGERRPLPPEVELTAYRVIQESVTNVIRHSGTSSCQVSIGHEADGLRIEIADSGHGPGPSPGGGHGLAGMRERVASLRGDFAAGPRPGGGFRVTARLPAAAQATAP